MLETIVLILLVVWLVASFGWGRRGRWRGRAGRWAGSNLLQIVLVIAVVLLLVRLIR